MMSILPFSFFSKKKPSLHVPDSLLVKQVKSLANNSNLQIFSNAKIFHHKEIHTVDLLIFDDTRGLFLFEIKKWSFHELQNATVQKAHKQEHASNTLAFEKTQELIKRKFNEIIHNDGVKIYNFVLMENMSQSEYTMLDESIKELLPQERIIFNDTSVADMFKKLQNVAPEDSSIPSGDFMLATLLTQYALLDENNTPKLCNTEQRNFLDAPLPPLCHLVGAPKSGKSSLVLLRAIAEILKGTAQEVIILKPTLFSKEKMYKKLLDIIEHGIIDIDPSQIEILTPLELCNKHLQKLKKTPAETLAEVDKKLYKKRFHAADIFFCDDADFIDEDFKIYLTNLQKNRQLLFCNTAAPTDTQHKIFTLHQQYTDTQLQFLQTNPFAKAIHLLSSLTSASPKKNILLLGETQNLIKLQEDVQDYLGQDVIFVHEGSSLESLEDSNVRLSNYDSLFDISSDAVILLDLSVHNEKRLEYTIHLAKKAAYILYENENEVISRLKENYESSKNS